MAGVTDPPFRELCGHFGAALTCGEMLSADQSLWHSPKSVRRSAAQARGCAAGAALAVQLAGSDPTQLADAARAQVAEGAQIIDLNLGCPAKKVCNRLCGSALLGDEDLVARIFEKLVRAVTVPVTVKIRTGPDPARRNATRIAQLAEQSGIAAIAVHGRTRAERFLGEAEYATIRDVKAAVRIPVIANGDIATAEEARRVLAHTRADGIMIGRAAHGRPWIFREFLSFLNEGKIISPPSTGEMRAVVLEHLEGIYALYGEELGVRVARKHIGWYCDAQPGGREFRACVMQTTDAREQLALVRAFLAEMPERQAA